ncbi:MAG: response regulator transcription factor [Solirubrobacteraceae bacterium]
MQTSVLIVDDDPGFGRAAAEVLTARGYRVLGQATSVADALAKCDQLDPDAVLVDVRLPDGDGVSLAEQLHARPHAPMVLLTSTDRKAVLPETLRLSGANGFVPKTRLADCDMDQFLRRR